MNDDRALPDDWLAQELASVRNEVALWPDGLKESFNSLPGVAPVPLGPAAVPSLRQASR